MKKTSKFVAIGLSAVLTFSVIIQPTIFANEDILQNNNFNQSFNLPSSVYPNTEAADIYVYASFDTQSPTAQSIYQRRNASRLTSYYDKISHITQTLRYPVGAVGFEGDYALPSGNEMVEIVVQFRTPSSVALRLLAQTSHPFAREINQNITDNVAAAYGFDNLALVAHGAFEGQLSAIPMPFAADAPQIIGSHYRLFNGVFMNVPASMVNAIAALPEVFAVTPNIVYFAIGSLEEPINYINDDLKYPEYSNQYSIYTGTQEHLYSWLFSHELELLEQDSEGLLANISFTITLVENFRYISSARFVLYFKDHTLTSLPVEGAYGYLNLETPTNYVNIQLQPDDLDLGLYYLVVYYTIDEIKHRTTSHTVNIESITEDARELDKLITTASLLLESVYISYDGKTSINGHDISRLDTWVLPNEALKFTQVLEEVRYSEYTYEVLYVAVNNFIASFRAGIAPFNLQDITLEDFFMREALETMNIPDVHNMGHRGQGVVVAVLDTGIDYNHPLLASNHKGGSDFINNTIPGTSPMETGPTRPGPTPPQDSWTSHGSHVAGSVVAVAPNAQIYSIRVLGPGGSSVGNSVMLGIERAHYLNVDVMNLSLGANVNLAFAPNTYALNLAVLDGVNVTVSAGNSGAATAGSLGTPGVASLVVTVGNAQRGGLGLTQIESSLINNSSLFLNLRGSAPAFDSGSFSGEHRFVYFGQLQNLPEAPNEYFINNFRQQYLNGQDMTGRIVAIFRGGTTFSSMRALAHELNASGLIIIDSATGAANSLENITTPIDGFANNPIPVFHAHTESRALFSSGEPAPNEDIINIGNFVVLPLPDNMNASSSRGPVTGTSHIKPDIVGPGTRIMSTVPAFIANANNDPYDYTYALQLSSGTSMSAPAVAGVIALMINAYSQASPAELKARIMNNARPVTGVPSAAILAANGGAFYSVFNIGAGFISPVDAINASHFATVMHDIPWLTSQTSFREEVMASLSFGTVPVGASSLPLIVNFSNQGSWTHSISFNGSANGATLTHEPLANGSIAFTMAFTQNTRGNFAEGNITFSNGSQNIIMPFAGHSFDMANGLYISQDWLGVVRPAVSGFIRQTINDTDIRHVVSSVVGASTASNISSARFNIQDPNHMLSYNTAGISGPSRMTTFFAVSIDENGNEDVFVIATFNLPTNTNITLTDIVRAVGSGRILPQGLYTLYADVDDINTPIYDNKIGKFVVVSERPTINFAHNIFEHEAGEDVQIYGYIYSFAHEMAIKHELLTLDFAYGDGSNPIFNYRFINFNSTLGNLSYYVAPNGKIDLSFSPSAASLTQPVTVQTQLLEALGVNMAANLGAAVGATIGTNISLPTPFVYAVRGLIPEPSPTPTPAPTATPGPTTPTYTPEPPSITPIAHTPAPTATPASTPAAVTQPISQVTYTAVLTIEGLREILDNEEDKIIEVGTVKIVIPFRHLAGIFYNYNLVDDIIITIYINYESDNPDIFAYIAVDISYGEDNLDIRYNLYLDLSNFELENTNLYRIVAMQNNVLVGGRIQEDSIFGFEAESSGVFTVIYLQRLNRLILTLTSYEITDLAENVQTQIMDVMPVIYQDFTLIPVRFIAYALGANVSWNEASHEVTLETQNQTLTFAIGELASGMDIYARIIDDRTFVPLRFIAEFFGALVSFNDTLREIEILHN